MPESENSAQRIETPQNPPGPPAAAAARTVPVGLYVIGAQKAGSTWLCDYLRGHEDCFFPPRKEIHYFSNPFYEKPQATEQRTIDGIAEISAQLDAETRQAARERLTRKLEDFKAHAAMFPVGKDDHAGYVAYMRRLYTGGQRYICDGTPAYAIVDRKTLRQMRDIYEVSKFIFTMREPVERAWSAARMFGAARDRTPETAQKQSIKILNRIATKFDPAKLSRDNYIRTIKNLDALVAPENRLYLFYETFFEGRETLPVTEFLEISPLDGNFGTRKMVGKSLNLDEDVANAVARQFRPIYEFAFEYFGDRVPQAWRDRYDAAMAS